MSEFRIDQIKSQDATRGPDVAGITTFTGTSGIIMPSGDTAYRGGRGRGIFGGGYNGGIKNIIDYVTITTTGNAIDFGDLTLATRSGSTTSNSIRTMFFGGYNAPNGGRMNIISYVNIMSTGNAQEFGDCKERGQEGSGSSDSHGGLS